MKQLTKYILVIATIVGMSLPVKVQASLHAHTYKLYSREQVYMEKKDCVTKGCKVTIYYYRDQYRCQCGKSFYENSCDDNNHSMRH